jgi:catechol 2,3-dioxygenase-like lactoylglutathione lyase family enzyme
MALQRISHVALNCANLAKSCSFYENALGFKVKVMNEPGYTAACAYIGDDAVLHLIERGVDQAPGTRGLIDHYAIEATDLREMLARLTKAGLEFHENPLPVMSIHQVVVRDPDGVKVELYFPLKTA